MGVFPLGTAFKLPPEETCVHRVAYFAPDESLTGSVLPRFTMSACWRRKEGIHPPIGVGRAISHVDIIPRRACLGHSRLTTRLVSSLYRRAAIRPDLEMRNLATVSTTHDNLLRVKSEKTHMSRGTIFFRVPSACPKAVRIGCTFLYGNGCTASLTYVLHAPTS